MAMDKNFSLRLDLDEANTIKNALEERMKDLILHIDAGSATDAEREEAGRIENMLRRDF